VTTSIEVNPIQFQSQELSFNNKKLEYELEIIKKAFDVKKI